MIRKLANFLYRHKKYNEAKLIKERLEDSGVAGLNRPDDIMYMEDSKVNVLATAEVIFHNGNRLTHCKCYGKYSTIKVLTFRKRVQTFDGQGYIPQWKLFGGSWCNRICFSKLHSTDSEPVLFQVPGYNVQLFSLV